MKKKILISTGGSGGHTIPALILHEHLSDNFETIISSDLRGLKYIGGNFSQINIINTPKLNNIILFPFNFFKILFLTIKSIILLKKEKIDKLISTGGYMSLPLCLSARILGLDIFLIEPNFVLGKANKFYLNFSKKIFCYSNEIKNFPSNLKEKIVLIKPLVRKEFYEKKIDLNKNDKFNLLIVGGSQGANIFDDYLKDVIIQISKRYSLKVIQQTNLNNIDNLRNFYKKNNIENYIFNFEYKFVNILHKSDLCITRAGASTLAELSVSNIPFLAIPLPSAKDDHQFENAIYYEKRGCCWVLSQKLIEEKIEAVLLEIIGNKNDYLKKKDNLKNFNYQNTWNDVNQKILEHINEN